MSIDRSDACEARIRRLATLIVSVLAMTSGLATSCRTPDCASTATCAEPSGLDAAGQDSAVDLDSGADAYQEPTARGPRCEGMGRACAGDDCCASTLVPGGSFKRSYDGAAGGEYDDPTFAATVSDFRLDVYEITIGRFRAFLAEYPKSLPVNGAGKNPTDPTDPGWDWAWSTDMPATRVALNAALHCGPDGEWTDTPADAETNPMPCMTWYEAFAFCIWDGGRLPTEAEWNYAAAGGSEQRVYPWSAPPTSSLINESYAVYDVQKTQGRTSPVGSKPKGIARWGQVDLAGNVAEWTVDFGRIPYRINPCDNCAEHDLGEESPVRVLRGGTAYTGRVSVRTSTRDYAGPSIRSYAFGARCARDP